MTSKTNSTPSIDILEKIYCNSLLENFWVLDLHLTSIKDLNKIFAIYSRECGVDINVTVLSTIEHKKSRYLGKVYMRNAISTKPCKGAVIVSDVGEYIVNGI